MAVNPLLTITIVTYNSFDVVCNCLDELLSSGQFKIIVVDNASTDSTGQKLLQQYPDIRLIQSDINLGYGRAANRAIAVADTPYLFLINPDLKATTATVKALLDHMREADDKTVLMAPAVFESDHTRSGPVETDWVIGAAMLFHLERLKPVGAFDENIFLFSEENDLCLRIRKAGLKILLDTDIYIEHLYRQSSAPNQAVDDLKDWHKAWSSMYFHTKHGLTVGKRNPKRMLIVYGIKYLLAAKTKKRALYKARYKGTLAFIKGEAAFKEDGTPRQDR